MIPYLKIIHLYKLYQDDQEELGLKPPPQEVEKLIQMMKQRKESATQIALDN